VLESTSARNPIFEVLQECAQCRAISSFELVLRLAQNRHRLG
jgi:hypothetical protein